MTAAVIVPVQPIHGWAWTDGDLTLETPSRFVAELARVNEGLSGIVVDQHHPYDGCSVTLSRRHEDWDGAVNVKIRSDSQQAIDGYALIPTEYLA